MDVHPPKNGIGIDPYPHIAAHFSLVWPPVAETTALFDHLLELQPQIRCE